MKRKTFKIDISDEAETDFDSSYSFYYNESPELADHFYKCVNTSFERIQKSPKSYPVVYKSLRKFKVKIFPFVIYYQIDGSAIHVIAIFHTSRNPKVWNRRIE